MSEKIKKLNLFKRVYSVISLSSFLISERRKRYFFLKLCLLFLLIFLKVYFPYTWINHGIFPALGEIVLFYISLTLVANVFRILLVSLYRKRHKYSSDHYDNLIIGLDRVFFLVVHIIFFFSFLFFFGVEMKVFLTTIGIFVVGIAIIFKENLSNIVDGIIIMFSRELKLKEYIRIGEFKGRIIDLNFLNIELKTDDGDIVYVPNSKVLNSEIINYSKSNVKRIRYPFTLDAKFFGDIEKLEKEISLALYDEFEDLVSLDKIHLRVSEVDNSKVSLILEIVVARYNFKIEEKVLSFVSRYVLSFIHQRSKSLRK